MNVANNISQTSHARVKENFKSGRHPEKIRPASAARMARSFRVAKHDIKTTRRTETLTVGKRIEGQVSLFDLGLPSAVEKTEKWSPI